MQNMIKTVFIKPFRNPVYKCAGSQQGFMEWAIYKAKSKYLKIFFLDVIYKMCLCKAGTDNKSI